MDVFQTALLTSTATARLMGLARLFTLSSGRGGELRDYLLAPERRKELLGVAWVLGVVLCLVLTGVAAGLARLVTGGWHVGIGIAVVVWALFLGGTALVFLSSRVITAMFGGLFGLGISEATSAGGVLEKMGGVLTSVAVQLGAIGGAVRSAAPDRFVLAMVWLFVVLLALVCLPAFFRD